MVWHVDDLKISHIDPKVVDWVLAKLSEEYGREAPITMNRGKVHDYLGMTLDYRSAGKVKISMPDYIAKMLEGAPPTCKELHQLWWRIISSW